MNRLVLLICLMVLQCIVLSDGQTAFAGQLKGDMRSALQQHLDDEGYLCAFPNGQGLQRGISAYLWDNRSWLKMTDFHNSRKIDVVVCLMYKKGYPGFDAYMANADDNNWCERIVGQP